MACSLSSPRIASSSMVPVPYPFLSSRYIEGTYRSDISKRYMQGGRASNTQVRAGSGHAGGADSREAEEVVGSTFGRRIVWFLAAEGIPGVASTKSAAATPM